MSALAENPRKAILETLKKRAFGPAELLLQLEQLTRLNDEELRDAISELLDERSIELSAERKLRIRQPEAGI